MSLYNQTFDLKTNVEGRGGGYSPSRLFELQHDKTNDMACVPSLIRVFAVDSKDSLGLLHADSEGSDQTGPMPRLI